MCRQITISTWTVVLITTLFLFHVLPIHAEARISGSSDALQIEAQDASIDEVLNALESRFGLHYRAMAALDRRMTGAYAGSLRRVLKRLLDGFDYVVKVNSGTLDVIIIGAADQRRAVPVPVPRHRSD